MKARCGTWTLTVDLLDFKCVCFFPTTMSLFLNFQKLHLARITCEQKIKIKSKTFIVLMWGLSKTH